MKHLPLVIALAASPLSHAQTIGTMGADSLSTMEEEMLTDDSNFTFTESQLGENDDITTDVIRINSATNIYASQIGIGCYYCLSAIAHFLSLYCNVFSCFHVQKSIFYDTKVVVFTHIKKKAPCIIADAKGLFLLAGKMPLIHRRLLVLFVSSSCFPFCLKSCLCLSLH